MKEPGDIVTGIGPFKKILMGSATVVRARMLKENHSLYERYAGL